MAVASGAMRAAAGTSSDRSSTVRRACSIAAATRSTSASGASTTVSLRPLDAISCPSSIGSLKTTWKRASASIGPGAG